VAPRLEGAKATVPAIGLPADSFEGKLCSAASHDHSEGNLENCAGEQLEADMPEPHCRARDLRFATQGRPKPQSAETFTLADCPYDTEPDRDTCPSGKVLKREARRHKIGNNIYRRDEAAEADCKACPRREKCLPHAETRRKPLAV
jgi:hypothetical protein